MQFTPFMFCCWSASKRVDIDRPPTIFPTHGDLTAPNGVRRRRVGRQCPYKEEAKVGVKRNGISSTGVSWAYQQ